MRKIALSISLLLLVGIFSTALVYAEFDWRQAESGRYNIRLEGFQGQPGYIAFVDDNTHVGVLFAHGTDLYFYRGSTTSSDLPTICADEDENDLCDIITKTN